MSIQKSFHEKLDSAKTAPCSIEVTEGTSTLVCQLDEIQPLACGVSRFVLSTPALAEASIDDLKCVSDQLASRLTYLVEPIGPVEFDENGCTVQMRSIPPQRDDNGSTYFELVVSRGGQLTLCRYHKQPGEVRAIIPATLTRETLVRLADDFSAVIV